MIKEKFGGRIDAWVEAAAPFLLRRPIDPNLLSVLGVLVSLGGSFAFGRGSFFAGGILILAGGFFDLVDGVVARRFASLPAAGEPRVLTGSRVETETPEGIPATLWLARPDERAVTLFRATGPRRHTREVEERAAERKVDLRDAATEAEIYESVGLPPLAPAER